MASKSFLMAFHFCVMHNILCLTKIVGCPRVFLYFCCLFVWSFLSSYLKLVPFLVGRFLSFSLRVCWHFYSINRHQLVAHTHWELSRNKSSLVNRKTIQNSSSNVIFWMVLHSILCFDFLCFCGVCRFLNIFRLTRR